MASENSVSGQSIIVEHDKEKKGDVAKQDEADTEEGLTETTSTFSEEKHDSDDVSVINVEKEEQHGEVDSHYETPNELLENFNDSIKASTLQATVISETRTEYLEDAEITTASEIERKPEKTPLIYTGSEDGDIEAEIQVAEAVKDKLKIDMIKPEDLKEEIQALISDASEAREKNVDLSSPTSIEAAVKCLEVESGSPEEQKRKVSAETEELSSNVSTIDDGCEVAESSSYEAKASGVIEVFEKKGDAMNLEAKTIQTSVKFFVDLETKPELAQTHVDENIFDGVTAKKDIEIVEGDEENESLKDGDATSVEAPKDKITIEDLLVEEKSEYSKSRMEPLDDKLVDFKKNVDEEAKDRYFIDSSTDSTTVEVSSDKVKASDIAEEGNSQTLEVAFIEVNIENLNGEFATSEEELNDIITADELFDHVSEEKSKSSSIIEAVVSLEETLYKKMTDVNVEAKEGDLVDAFLDPISAKLSFEEVDAPETFVIVKPDSNKQTLEVPSKESDIAAEASMGDKISTGDEEKRENLEVEDATSVEESKDASANEDSIDQVIEDKNESFVSELEAPSYDRLISNEKDVNVEIIERDLVDTATFPAAAKVSSEQINASETAGIVKDESDKETQELVFKKLNFSFESSAVSAGERTNESLIGEGEALMVAPKEVIIVEESLQVIEELKRTNDFGISELSTEAVKDILPSEAREEKKYETPNDLIVEEMEVKEFDDKEKEVKVGGDFQTVKPEQEGLEAENNENKKSKNQVSYVSSDTGDTKLTKETKEMSKGQSYIFYKHAEDREEGEAAEHGGEETFFQNEKKAGDDEASNNLEGFAGTASTPNISEEKHEMLSDMKEISSFQATAISELKTEDLKDREIKPTFDDGKRPVEASLNSNGVDISEDVNVDAETQEAESPKGKVASRNEIQLLVLDASKALEKNDVNSSYRSIIEVPIKDLEVESGSPQEQKSKDGVETKEPSSNVITVGAEDTSVEDDIVDTMLKVYEVSLQGGNVLNGDKLVDKEKVVDAETVQRDLVDTSADFTEADVSSDQVKASESIEIAKDGKALDVMSEELNIASKIEVLSEDDEVSAGDKVKSESLKNVDGTYVEAPEDIIDINESSNQLVFEVNESSKSDMEARKDDTTAKEWLNQAIEKNQGFESVTEGLAKDKMIVKGKNGSEETDERNFFDTSTILTITEVSSEQVNASEIVNKGDKNDLEVPSNELNIESEVSEVSSNGSKDSVGNNLKTESSKGEDATRAEAPEDVDQVVKDMKGLSSNFETEVHPKDELFDIEKEVNVVGEEIVLADTSTVPYFAKIDFEQVKALESAEIVKEQSNKEALELNAVHEAGEVSAGVEKGESLKGEDTPLVEAEKVNTIEESLDQVIDEHKSVPIKNGTQVLLKTTKDLDVSGLSPVTVKDTIASKTVEEKDNTSHDFIVEEKKTKEYEEKEVNVEGDLHTDKPEQDEMVAEVNESANSKNRDLIVSSDTVDANQTKAVTKRQSNILSKMKRSIIKAKKAILGKSPTSKIPSREAKHENT